MINYLVKIGDLLKVIPAKGFTPEGTITVVPSDISPEDFPYLKVRELTDETSDFFVGYDVSVDQDKKDAGIAAESKRLEDEAMRNLRSVRDSLLSSSDFTQMNDSPLSDELKAEYVTYRQALRDLPSTVEDVHNPIYPLKPGAN